MSFEIHAASRQGIKPLVGFYGKSGSGKTMSALLLARGIAGPTRKITLIDSENGRGSIFADLIPGGYGVLNLDAPFSPARYEEAIAEAEKSSDVVLVDSMSHEWSGEGGVLDWAEEELQRMGGGDNNKMRSWVKPKMAHKKMVQRLLRSKCALICCLRGEEKTHITKPEAGQKAKVITDEFSTPLFDPRFIYELLLNFETVAHSGVGGFIVPRKITHPSIAAILPRENEQISIKHGEALAAWCASAGSPAGVSSLSATVTAPKSSGDASDEKQKLELELWGVLKSIRTPGKKGFAEVNAWLWREEILDAAIEPPQTVESLTPAKLREVISKAKAKLGQLV
jgi:hypothetical protein